MKIAKRLGALVMALSMVAGLAACGGEKVSPVTQEVNPGTQTLTPAAPQTTEPEVTAPVVEEPKNGIVLRTTYAEAFGILNEEGDLVASYDMDDLVEKYDKEGLLEDAYPSAYYKDHIIFYKYRYDDSGENWVEVVALNPNTGKLHSLGRYSTYGLETIDVYKDRLYVDSSSYEDGHHYYEDYFTYDAVSDSFVKATGDLQELIDSYNPGTIVYNSLYARSGMGVYSCLERSMDECGFIVVYLGDGYCLIDAKGNRKSLEQVDSYPLCYAKDFIFYNVYFDDGMTSLFVYDTLMKKSHCVTDSYDQIAGVAGGKLYFANDFSGEYGVYDYHYFSYDPLKGVVEELFESYVDPAGSAYYIYSNFLAVNDKMYFVRSEDGAVEWYKADFSSKANRSIDKTGLQVCTYGYEGIDIDYISNTTICEYCGNPLYKYFGQYPVLNREVYAFADEINAVLLEDVLRDEEASGDDELLQPEDNTECADHMSYWYCQTTDRNISSIKIVWDHYMMIDINSYWYGGGAHGYPGIEQYLFDLNSGELIRFADIYPGTEEEFRTIVAENTRAMAAEMEYEYSPFYTDDVEAIYADAYEYCSLYSGEITFGEQCLYYNFSPYSLGPFASGFISIEIPYYELELGDYFK